MLKTCVRNKFKFAAIVFLILIIYSCNSCGSRKAEPADISQIELNLSIVRFDSILFETSLDNLDKVIEKFRNENKEFFTIYVEHVMRFGRVDDSLKRYLREIEYYVRNPDMRQLYDSIKAAFPDNSFLRNELTEAFKYYKYYFPEQPTPVIYAFQGATYHAVVTGKDVVGIGLDMHLGKKFSLYQMIPNMYDYIKQTCTKESMTSRVMQALLQGQYSIREETVSDLFKAKNLDELEEKMRNPKFVKATNMLDFMIYNGKILHCLDSLLPDVPDSIKIGYSKEEMDWIKAGEAGVWKYLLDHDLLYETERAKFFKYVSQGPTTAGLPPESPGNIGSFEGWQIVRSFMSENQDIRLRQLMEDTSVTSQRILKLSLYNP